MNTTIGYIGRDGDVWFACVRRVKEAQLPVVSGGQGLHQLAGLGQLLEQAAEFQRLEERNHGVLVIAAQLAGFRVIDQIEITHDGDQPLVALDLGPAIDQTLARLRPGDFVNVGVEIVERAVLGEQLGRGLFAHAGHPRNIIRTVTGKGLEIDKLRRGERITFGQLCQPINTGHWIGAARGVKDLHPLIDQLEHVTVAGEDQHIIAHLTGLQRKRAQHIIRFIVGVGDDGNVKRLQQLGDALHLRAHLVRHGIARRFVVAKFTVPPSIAQVKGDRDLVWLIFLDHAEQFARKAIDRTGQLARARRKGRLHAKIGPIRLRMAVDE